MNSLRFAKGHGLGNDYLVVERHDLPWPLTVPRIQAICDRHHGIGSDGVLIADIDPPSFALRIYNPDGSEAEKSGNGLRIFGAYLYLHGHVGLNQWFDVALVKDTVQMRVEEELDGGALQIRAALGRASFAGADSGFAPQAGEVRGVDVPLAHGRTATINPLSLANPHCVVFVERLERTDFLERAPQLCTHAVFPKGTNVQFARVVNRHTCEAWIWERGVGETLASGSSSCAVAAAALHNGLIDAGLIEVRMPGGTAEVEISGDYDVKLRAPAAIVLEGEVRAEVAARW
ncbi:MAG TPA: diaminopimelate epimerase [Longimicrobiales bacterium]|nr:diaminopimelate epimerase [Longimicrobiales bacterium]